MKSLLIVGAGSHGCVVREIAEACGYEKVAFIDDHHPRAIGTTNDLQRYAEEYPEAIVGIGNGKIRAVMQQRLIECGYRIPVLIHPRAYVSPTAAIGCGTVIEPMAAVNTKAYVGEGVIISIGSRVDHETVIGNYSHINAGAIVMAYSNIPEYTKIDAGIIVKE